MVNTPYFFQVCIGKEIFFKKKMEKETWKNISIREKMQIINGTGLIISSVILYFVCFFLTMTIGMGVISAGGTMLATGLALFGITGFVKNQMVNFEAKVNNKITEMERMEKKYRNDTESRQHRVEED